MASELALAAVDLGAASGRVALGRLRGERLELRLVHRFANRPLRLPDGLHWNLLGLLEDILDGLARAAFEAKLEGVAVDAWGVDYGLLDGEGRLLGLPYHYRDARTAAGVLEAAHALVSPRELYARCGIQQLEINTVYQLFSERGRPAARIAERIAFIPELVAMWLCGELVGELTVASTSALLDARSGRWARDLAARLGLPETLFRADPLEPCRPLGRTLPIHAPAFGGARPPVHLIAGHDTACAFLAAPLRGGGEAVLSCGTWSLLGLELPEPLLSASAFHANLSNERGVEGTTRLLANVMGLWLLQEAEREFAPLGSRQPVIERLLVEAERAPAEGPLFDPDAPPLLRPGALCEKIATLCRESGQRAPAAPGPLVRSIVDSLACKYRLIAERLARVTGQRLERVHLLGGGVRNRLLAQRTADLLGIPVQLGSPEASALGNLLCQLRALGEVGSLSQMRELARRSLPEQVLEPLGEHGDELYERFLCVTGLGDERALGRGGERQVRPAGGWPSERAAAPRAASTRPQTDRANHRERV